MYYRTHNLGELREKNISEKHTFFRQQKKPLIISDK